MATTTTLATNLGNSTSLGNQISFNDSPLVCNKGFFFDQNDTGVCRPICGEFRSKSLGYRITEMVLLCVCFIASILLFIMALMVQRDAMLRFPSILYVYISITIFVISGVLIVGFFDSTGLFCGSRDLIYALGKGNSTVFCSITGFIFYYGYEQITVWIMLHTVFLYWAVRFPLSYMQLNNSGRLRYAHIASILLGLIVPLPAGLVPLKYGYILDESPAMMCFGSNTDVTYYTFILHICIFLAISTCLLALLFWTIFRNFVLKKLTAKNITVNIGITEVKICFITIYYIMVGVMGQVLLTYYGVSSTSRKDLAIFFLCESLGNLNCLLNSPAIKNVRNLRVTVTVLLYLLPVVIIIFSCNVRVWKEKLKLCSKAKNNPQ